MARIVDLSLDIYDQAPTFWPDPKTSVTPHLNIANLKYNITRLCLSTHLGTHLDAPFHFFDEGRTVDQLDLTRCLGPAWVLDFTPKQPDEEITLSEFKTHNDKIQPGARLIVKTGWDQKFPDDIYFNKIPRITVEACQFLADRKIAALAMDLPSVNYSSYVESHHALLNAEILIVEGLAHLEQLQSDRVFLSTLPLRIRGRDGSPCRALAIDGLPDLMLDELECSHPV